ncbi:MAG: hypothetical protein GY820_23725, partial [Gammaproteobacteria bacterium]|nr:hypothetical protein [Gammaproteobacteria bacterium]
MAKQMTRSYRMCAKVTAKAGFLAQILLCFVALLAIHTSAPAADFTFTSPATISASNTTYENLSIVVDGTVLTIDGVHTFSELQLINGATLTHSAGAADKLELVITTMNISADSAIDVSRKGNNYNADATGVGSHSGGSYGGSGGGGANGAYTTNEVYGDYLAPQEFGTGGHDTSLGGGSVKLTVANLTLNGVIRSNGGDGHTSHKAGGSGGSVWLEINALSGSGSIEANGGT